MVIRKEMIYPAIQVSNRISVKLDQGDTMKAYHELIK